MYPGTHVQRHADTPAVIMAGSGEAISYAELDARSNRLAHLLRAEGLKRLDHYAVFMENHARYVETCSAGERSGLYYTCINAFLNADELAYVVDNCEAQVLITSRAKADVALAALRDYPRVALCLVVDDDGSAAAADHRCRDYAAAVATYRSTPIDDRYDRSTLEIAIHAAAPCPTQVKRQMIDWWGPIVHEYYGATEGLGFTACDSAEWLAHPGTVGRVLLGDLHILDETMQGCAPGVPGEIWFKTATPFEYFNDPARTAQTRSADGAMSTVGDVGYIDADGFLHLTDRSTFMIVSGGVNIYPQECENLLIVHPKVADAAVFGVPNDDLGEEVKAVVQTLPGLAHSPELVVELSAELLAYCAQRLAHYKCPRSIDFTDALPRLPTGKLYKKALRDTYWAGHASRIV